MNDVGAATSSGSQARARFDQLHPQQEHLRLFALVDGQAFQALHGQSLQPGPGKRALFDGTPDAPLAPAGPWLLDLTQPLTEAEQLLARERDAPHVSWLLAELTLDGLAQLLQLQLDAWLPDGRTALLRFYDPRVLYGLATTLTAPQRVAFFAHIQEWHFEYEGQPMRITRRHE